MNLTALGFAVRNGVGALVGYDSTAITLGTWHYIVSTFRESSDKKCRIYIGSLAAPMAEAT